MSQISIVSGSLYNECYFRLRSTYSSHGWMMSEKASILRPRRRRCLEVPSPRLFLLLFLPRPPSLNSSLVNHPLLPVPHDLLQQIVASLAFSIAIDCRSIFAQTQSLSQDLRLKTDLAPLASTGNRNGETTAPVALSHPRKRTRIRSSFRDDFLRCPRPGGAP